MMIRFEIELRAETHSNSAEYLLNLTPQHVSRLIVQALRTDFDRVMIQNSNLSATFSCGITVSQDE